MTPDPVDVAVGARIRARRRALRISQAGLAEVLGLTFQQVQKYERGINRISASMLVKAAAKLQTSVAELIGETGAAPTLGNVEGRLVPADTEDLLSAYANIRTASVRRAIVELVQSLSSAGLGSYWSEDPAAVDRLSALRDVDTGPQ